MTLQLYDTLAGATREFVPLEAGHVRIYSCGPTVYGPAHVGNFRSFLFADLLVRYLRYKGLDVTWVTANRRPELLRALTDGNYATQWRSGSAQAQGVPIEEVSERYRLQFLADMHTLGVALPDVMPCATEHIPQMVALIQTLLEKGHAYRTDDGSIFFRISSWPAYGRLARLDPEGMRVGERVESDEYGKPLRYFEHPRRTALLLMDEMGIMDVELVIAALLHDGIEGTRDLTPEMIEHAWGREVCRIVMLLSKQPRNR